MKPTDKFRVTTSSSTTQPVAAKKPDSSSSSLASETTLPADLGVLTELRRELSSPSQNGDKVSRLIFQDPALILGFAKVTYSVQQGLGDPLSVTSPWQMVTRLGIDRAITVVDQIAQAPQPLERLHVATTAQRRYALRVALFCKTIMRQVNPQLAEAAELVGLLGAVGHLLGLLTHRDRFLAVLEETHSHAKANYRLQKELNFDLELETAEFLRVQGIPEKIVTCIEREPNSPGTQTQVELRTCFHAATEVTNAFEEGRAHLYDPKRPLPANSALRLFQLTDSTRTRLYEALQSLQAPAESAAPQVTEVQSPVPRKAFETPALPSSKTEQLTPSSAEPDTLEEDLLAQIVRPKLFRPSKPGEKDPNSISPLNGFVPSPARQKRIKQLRANARDFLAAVAEEDKKQESPPVAGDVSLEFGQAIIDGCIKHNPLVSDAVRGIQRIESMFGSSRVAQARELTCGVVQLIAENSTRYQAALFFAAKAYYPHLLERERNLRMEAVIEMLLPSEVAAILALTHLYQQLTTKIDKQKFGTLSQSIKQHTELGRLVGWVVPTASTGLGLVLAGFRGISAAILNGTNSDSLNRFTDRIQSNKNIFDLSYEASQFRTTHLDVCSFLLQRMGFGASLAQSTLPGCFRSPQSESALLLSWVESIYLSGTPFAKRELGERLGVDRESLVGLRDRVTQLNQQGEPCAWLGRDKSDLKLAGVKSLQFS